MTLSKHNPLSSELFPLDEKKIALLEEQWECLPQQAYSESTPSGWRVVLKVKDGVFSKLGFKGEQELPAHKLLAVSAGQGQKALLERILAIFEHIRRPTPAN